MQSRRDKGILNHYTITHVTQILDALNRSTPVNSQPSPPSDKTIGSEDTESSSQTTEGDTITVQHIPLSDELRQKTLQSYNPIQSQELRMLHDRSNSVSLCSLIMLYSGNLSGSHCNTNYNHSVKLLKERYSCMKNSTN